MPDPKLKEVMKEIQAVLAKHDVAGLVILSSPKHLEYLLQLEASWTCMRLEVPLAIRFRSLAKDFPSKADQKRCTEESLGTVIGLADVALNLSQQLSRIAVHIGKHFGSVEHFTRAEPPEDPSDPPRI